MTDSGKSFYRPVERHKKEKKLGMKKEGMKKRKEGKKDWKKERNEKRNEKKLGIFFFPSRRKE